VSAFKFKFDNPDMEMERVKVSNLREIGCHTFLTYEMRIINKWGHVTKIIKFSKGEPISK